MIRNEPEELEDQLIKKENIDQLKLTSSDESVGMFGDATVKEITEAEDEKLKLDVEFTPDLEWDYESQEYDLDYEETSLTSEDKFENEPYQVTYSELNSDEHNLEENNTRLNSSGSNYEIHSKDFEEVSSDSRSMDKFDNNDDLQEAVSDEINRSVHAPIILGICLSTSLLGGILLIGGSWLSIPILIISGFAYMVWRKFKDQYNLQTKNVI